MQLIDQLNINDSLGYFEPAFRQVLEEHLGLIRTYGISQVLSVPSMLALRFQGDYFGLLTEMRVPVYLHWVTLRLNGLLSPADSSVDTTSVQTVDSTYIKRLYNTYKTQSKTKLVSLK